ncbi:MAG: LuxR C-terminal-related transcriptional regulator [Bacteroidota bacterium]
MPIPLLATKLFKPPLRPRFVARSHLITRLEEGQQSRLILVSAPAGYGKTTLVSEWLADTQRPAAWLSLDEGDNDPARFLSYVIAALGSIFPGLGQEILELLQSPQPLVTGILPSLLNELAALPNNFVLVLDDFHIIDSGPVVEVLTYLLEHQPAQMQLVITTREDPSLSLARYRARGQLIEIRASNLCFTSRETADFLNRIMDLTLSPEDIASLQSRTEGWIVGLQLAAISMQGRGDVTEFINSFTGSHRFILDYLLEEVLQQQPPNIQNFLLHTSILERMCGPLCDALLLDPTASGQVTLEYLERANLFIVPLDADRRWYRYHHLFGDLLRQRLMQSLVASSEQEKVEEYHRRASTWYEENDLLLDAFQHAASANDLERAERLIQSRRMPIHYRSAVSVLLDWLASLPATVKDAHPSLWVKSATLSLVAGISTGVEEKLQAAEALLQNAALDDHTRDLVGQIAAARATLAMTRYQPEEITIQARRALQYLPAGDLPFRFTANWTLAIACYLQGDRAGAKDYYREALAISQLSGDAFSIILAATGLAEMQEFDNQLYQAAETYRSILPLFGGHPQPNACDTYLGLARISYQWNDLEAAEQYGQESLRLARLYDRVIDRFIISELFLAQLKLAQGDTEAASAILSETELSIRKSQFVQRLPELAAMRMNLLIKQGDLETAAQLAGRYNLPLSQARVFLARKEPSAALKTLDLALVEFEARGWADERLKALVLKSVSFSAGGEKEQALQVLSEALNLAEPGGFIRLFLDEGQSMEQLLAETASQAILPEYSARLLSAFAAERGDSEKNPVEPLIETLSARELEVLCLIAQGLSNQEIGERLFLALSSVKGHNQRIFEKLQVQRRTEAVARARELGLL